MPTGNQLLDAILGGGLTGRALAALASQNGLQGVGSVGPTPPFMPGPTTPPFVPSLPQVNLPPIATPGEAGSSSLPLGPQVPVDQTVLMEIARQQAEGLLGPGAQAQAPAPGGFRGFLGGLAQALQSGVSAGLTDDPGRALLEIARREQEQKNLKEQGRREDAQRRQRLTTELFLGGLSEAKAEQRSEASDKRAGERAFQAEVRADQRVAAAQALEDYRAQLRTIADERKSKEAAESERLKEERKQATQDEKDARLQANTFIDDFKIPRAQAVRFAKYEVSGTPLSAADQKVYDRIEKYRPNVGGRGGGVSSRGTGEKLAQFEIVKGQLGAARARGDVKGEDALIKKLDTMAAGMPSSIETGYDPTGKWPYAKVRGTNPQAQPAATGGAESPKRAQARIALKANGYGDAEATAELDRLGVN